MGRDVSDAPVKRRAFRCAGSGQSITELALIAPILVIVLLGIVELSGAYGAKMDLQAASAQAARTGSLEGDNGATTCPGTSVAYHTANAPYASGQVTTDPVDRDIVKAVLGTHGINVNSISQIQVYDATTDGTPYGAAINTYVPPFIASAISGTQTITGAYFTATPGWPSCTRNPDELSDSIGIHITYRYAPITPIFGRATITMDDQAVQRLNPSPGAVPCPIPGYPGGLSVVVTSPPVAPTPSNDVVSWGSVPLASRYTIYRSISGINGGQFSTTPVATAIGQTQATIPVTLEAPTSYQVTGSNFCGEGERSVSVNDGRPDAAATATAAGQATATAAAAAQQTATAVAAAATATAAACTTPPQPTISSINAPATGPLSTTDTITWTVASGTADTWLITQTITGTVTGTKTVASLPLSTTMTIPSPPYNSHTPASYVVQGVNTCGKSGTPSTSRSNGRH